MSARERRPAVAPKTMPAKAKASASGTSTSRVAGQKGAEQRFPDVVGQQREPDPEGQGRRRARDGHALRQLQHGGGRGARELHPVGNEREEEAGEEDVHDAEQALRTAQGSGGREASDDGDGHRCQLARESEGDELRHEPASERSDRLHHPSGDRTAGSACVCQAPTTAAAQPAAPQAPSAARPPVRTPLSTRPTPAREHREPHEIVHECALRLRAGEEGRSPDVLDEQRGKHRGEGEQPRSDPAGSEPAGDGARDGEADAETERRAGATGDDDSPAGTFESRVADEHRLAHERPRHAEADPVRRPRERERSELRRSRVPGDQDGKQKARPACKRLVGQAEAEASSSQLRHGAPARTSRPHAGVSAGGG